ncbi:MAG: PIN domain-containing protein [bacterium]
MANVALQQDVRTRAIQLRREYRLKLPDAIIVASAMVENAALVTHDQQLAHLPGLKCLPIVLDEAGSSQ